MRATYYLVKHAPSELFSVYPMHEFKYSTSSAPTNSYPSIATLICIILEVYNNNLSHVMESGCDIFCMRNFE